MPENRFMKYVQPEPSGGFVYAPPPDPSKARNEGREERRLRLSEQSADNTNRKTLADLARAPIEAETARIGLELKRQELIKQRALSGQQLNPDTLAAVRADAVTKINSIRQIRGRIEGMPFPNATGAGFGDWLRHVPATAAHGIDAKIGTLKAGGALSEVLKLSAATGKNPFTPMSNSDVELISRNIGNLDQGQPAKDLIGELDLYERAYGRAFIGAKGDPRKLRDVNRRDGPWPGLDAASRKNTGAKPKVIDFNDLAE